MTSCLPARREEVGAPPPDRPLHHPRPGIYNAVLRSDRFGTGHRLGIRYAPAGGPLQITDHICQGTHCCFIPWQDGWSERRPSQQSSATWQWPRVMCSWSRAAQVPDRISDPQILDSFRFPGFPQQRSLSGGKQRRNSASSEEAPAAQLPRPGGVGCCVEKTAALSDLKTCTTSGICDSVLDSSVALPDALALSRGSPLTGASRVDAQNRLPWLS